MRVVAHALFIKCIHLAAVSHVKSAGRGAYAHAAKKDFFKTRIVISVTVCTE